MASPARWVHRVEIDSFNGRVLVTVGPNHYTTSSVEVLESLPRQDLRRVMGHLGYKAPLQLSNEVLLSTIRSHCANPANVEENGRVRSRGERGDSGSSSPRVEETPAPAPAPAPRGERSSLERQVEEIARGVVSEALEERGVTASIDEEEVRRIARSVLPVPQVFHIGNVEVGKIEGRLHRDFQEMLERVSAWENLFLTGGPGVGKTHVTKQVAQALGVPCVVLSADPLPQKVEVIGGHNPLTGQVIKGSVRDIYESGGVFVFDEMDTAHVSLGTSLNKLLSSHSFDFPKEGGGVEEIERHPRCVFMATGNTYGQGGDHRFMGTTRMNGASLDRFTFMHVDCDEQLVREILEDRDAANGTGFAPRVFTIWSTARANIDRNRLDVVCSPRAAFAIHSFLVRGLDEWRACRGRLFQRGAGSDVEAKILEGITLAGRP